MPSLPGPARWWTGQTELSVLIRIGACRLVTTPVINDGRAIPITKLDAPAGRYGNRIDGPTTVAGKQNGPDAGDPCDLGHIAGERDAVSFRERLAHAHKSTDAALAVETAKMVAGAPNGPDAQPLGSNCIDLPIAVGRYQDLCLEGRTPEKGAS